MNSMRAPKPLLCLVLGALATAVVPACDNVESGGDTGLVLATYRAESTNFSAAVDTLDFTIGVETTDGAGFLRDKEGSISEAVSGRDLAAEPFELLLRGVAGQRVRAVVFARAGDVVVAAGTLESPQELLGGMFLRRTIALVPVADGDPPVELDTGCVLVGGEAIIVVADDRDCDGVAVTDDPADCNDADRTIYPGATELCDELDNDCNNEIDESDRDGDGHMVCDDCDDDNADIHPGADEHCNGRDDDCDGTCDNGQLDDDGDGWNTCAELQTYDGCTPPTGSGDCDDDDATIYPMAPEVCNGADDNCDDKCDEGWDLDADGYTECGSQLDVGGFVVGCFGVSPLLEDCQELIATVHPFANEICDGYDNDCDTHRLERQYCFTDDGDGDGCELGLMACDDDLGGGAGLEGDCNINDFSASMPSAACDAYGECADDPATDADPFTCAADAAADVADRRFSCTLAVYWDDGDEQFRICSGASTPLATAPPMSGCSHIVIGDRSQEHYEVGLFSGPFPMGLAETSYLCDANLAVAALVDWVPQSQRLFVRSVYQPYGGTTANWVMSAYDIRPVPVMGRDDCPERGLQCAATP